MAAAHRIEVLHGVNLDMLGRRDPRHYGEGGRPLSLLELERRIESFAAEEGLRVRCFQTNAEAEMVGRLHRLADEAEGAIINAGAWTHYAWALRDALEIGGVPAVEVHLSDVDSREPWRRLSVFDGLCAEKISGRGPEGYRVAMRRLRGLLDGVDG